MRNTFLHCEDHEESEQGASTPQPSVLQRASTAPPLRSPGFDADEPSGEPRASSADAVGNEVTCDPALRHGERGRALRSPSPSPPPAPALIGRVKAGEPPPPVFESPAKEPPPPMMLGRRAGQELPLRDGSSGKPILRSGALRPKGGAKGATGTTTASTVKEPVAAAALGGKGTKDGGSAMQSPQEQQEQDVPPEHKSVLGRLQTAIPGSPQGAGSAAAEQGGKPRRGNAASGSREKQHRRTGRQEPQPLTTVMLRNLPNNYSRSHLMELLDARGFARHYNFIYFPMDFRTHAAVGYAFVNMEAPEDAEELWRKFQGFDEWAVPSAKVCAVSWSQPHQGLAAHVARYRNSPLMHASVPDEYRPVLLRNGEVVPFPEPTKRIKPPRQGTERMFV